MVAAEALLLLRLVNQSECIQALSVTRCDTGLSAAKKPKNEVPTKKPRIAIILDERERSIAQRKADEFNMKLSTFCAYTVKYYLSYHVKDPLKELKNSDQLELDFD